MEILKLTNHLLYIDITQYCGIGCDFCMYSDKHNRNHMVLSENAKENLSRLINSPEVSRISISGEGEPLNNSKTILEILKLSNGGRKFELITSGYWHYEKLASFYSNVDMITSGKGDKCNIRLSSDSHHIPKIKNRPHGMSIKDFTQNKYKSLSLSFRSIDPDKEFTRAFLVSEAMKVGYRADIKSKSELEEYLEVDGLSFAVDYKNLIKPNGHYKHYLSMWEYIKVIEEKNKKPFKLGSQTKDTHGLDITIKPNGDVFYYGIEDSPISNINNDQVSFDSIKENLMNNELAKKLHLEDFSKVIYSLASKEVVEQTVQRVNNPYWVVKELMTQ